MKIIERRKCFEVVDNDGQAGRDRAEGEEVTYQRPALLDHFLCRLDNDHTVGSRKTVTVGLSLLDWTAKMTANVLPTIFTIEIGDTPTLAFEAHHLREAHELCHEQWLKDDLAEAKSDGVPLWDGKAKLRARIALPDERVAFAEATNNGGQSDGLMLVYLVELDGGTTDEELVDPGAFPPART